MLVDPDDRGSVLAPLARATLLAVVASACASTATERLASVSSELQEVRSHVEPPADAPPQDAHEQDAQSQDAQSQDAQSQGTPQQGSQTPPGQKWGNERKTIKDFGTPDDGSPPPKAAEEPAPKETPPPAAPAAASAPDSGTGLPDWIHGSFSARYRGRWDTGGHDNDLGGILGLDLGDPLRGWISGHLQARVDWDLDGKQPGNGFESLQDTYEGSVVAKLYIAYADVAVGSNPEDRLGTLRVGRQQDPLLPEVLRLDGVSYTTTPMGTNEVQLGVYGGIPVHLYEASHDGDNAFGSFLEGIPWQGGRARLDWMHVRDENVLGEGEDDLVTLGLQQQLNTQARLEGDYSSLDGTPRDLRLRAMYDDPDSQTNLRLGYYELLRPQNALVTELDPFFEQLATYEPYRETTFDISHVFGPHTTVDVGIDVRRLDNQDDVGEFNRNWERYYTTATFNDVATKGLSMSVTGDRWDDHQRDIYTLGADVTYAAEKRWKASIGSYYSLYKYVFLQLDEQDNVRTYYLRTTYDLTARAQLEFLYELEDDSLGTFNTLRLGARWRF